MRTTKQNAAAAVAAAAACLASVSALGMRRVIAAQQTAGPESAYKESCARCHDQPTGRTPSREGLRDRSAEAILMAMNSGSMSSQAQQLTASEKRGLAEYLAGKPLGTTAAAANMCPATPAKPGNALDVAGGDRGTGTAAAAARSPWNGWGADTSNTRYQPRPGLRAEDVPTLKLKWAFGFPGGAQAYGNPAIVAGRVYVGSDTGVFYSLDASTGCTYWSYQADAGIRAAPTLAPASGDRPGHDRVYVADLKANVYALDAATGELTWKKSVDSHRFARITGSPKLHEGRLYIPVSSFEEGPAAQPAYQCCTFRGSVVALEAASGTEVWKSYTIAETPQQVGMNSTGTARWAPAGAAVWNSPTIDPAKGALYIGTGNSYTEPAVKTSDSVIAMDLKTGKILWWNQVTPADAFLVGCRPGV
jgi:polyvinyl alcohol dehydrogenase (cytochrome)